MSSSHLTALPQPPVNGDSGTALGGSSDATSNGISSITGNGSSTITSNGISSTRRPRVDWTDLSWSERWRGHLVRLPRHVPRATLKYLTSEGPYPFIVKIPSRFQGHRIPVWVYIPPQGRPLSAASGQSHSTNGETYVGGTKKHTIPLHIDFHGGGFISGGPREQAPFCAKIARERGCVVLSVDYSTGPLYQFPAALEDSEDVVHAAMDDLQVTTAGRTLYQAIEAQGMQLKRYRRASDGMLGEEDLRVDPKRLSISGFSSGANIALNLVVSTGGGAATPAQQERNFDQERAWISPIRPDIQPFPVLLFSPQYQQRCSPADTQLPLDLPVSKPSKFGASLEKRLGSRYLPEHYHKHPRASPALQQPDTIHSKARFFVALSERDSLTYHAHEWVDRLREAGWSENKLKVFDTPKVKQEVGRFSVRVDEKAHEDMTAFWDSIEMEAAGETSRKKAKRKSTSMVPRPASAEKPKGENKWVKKTLGGASLV